MQMGCRTGPVGGPTSASDSTPPPGSSAPAPWSCAKSFKTSPGAPELRAPGDGGRCQVRPAGPQGRAPSRGSKAFAGSEVGRARDG